MNNIVSEIDNFIFQAFSIPVIQIVYETLKDQQEGKKGKTTIKTGGGGKIFLQSLLKCIYSIYLEPNVN